MSRITKAMLEEENEMLRSTIRKQVGLMAHLREKVDLLQVQPNILQTMAITVQRVASVTENLLQSIPSIEQYARMKGEGGGEKQFVDERDVWAAKVK